MPEREYIARTSYGKDSLKMLQVIRSRGLPLDRSFRWRMLDNPPKFVAWAGEQMSIF